MLEVELPQARGSVPGDELAGDAEAIEAIAEAEDVIAAAAKDLLTYATEQFIAATNTHAGRLDWLQVEAMVERSDGIPAAIGQRIRNAATNAASE